MSDRPLSGKVALVTGAARGIGRAIAVELASLGADVAVTARTLAPSGDALPGSVEETAEQVKETGSRVLALAADLTRPADRSRIVDETVAAFGRIDILVNAAADAGPNVFRAFWETTTEEWAAQIDLNLNSMYGTMKAAAPIMRANGGGIIFNLGSMREIPEGLPGPVPEEIAAKVTGGIKLVMHGKGLGGAGQAYPTSKVAVYTMSTVIADELINDNIVVLTVNPGSAATENAARNAKLAGLEPGGIPVELASKSIGFIASSPDPKIYAGLFIVAEKFAPENGIVIDSK